MKKIRRIEIIRYRRRIIMDREGGAPDRTELPAIDILPEVLGDAAAPEEFRAEIDGGGAEPPRATFLRGLLRLPRMRD